MNDNFNSFLNDETEQTAKIQRSINLDIKEIAQAIKEMVNGDNGKEMCKVIKQLIYVGGFVCIVKFVLDFKLKLQQNAPAST